MNAFSLCWTALKFYAFPPFSILGRVLAKVQQDGDTGMLVTLFWSTEPWFPQLLELLIDHPRILQPRKDLQLNGKLDMVHPLHSKLYIYDDGGQFGVIATARSALDNFIHVPGVPVLANHPLIQEVVKGHIIPDLLHPLRCDLGYRHSVAVSRFPGQYLSRF